METVREQNRQREPQSVPENDHELVDGQVFYLFHTPAPDRTAAAREVCDALTEANGRMFDRRGLDGAYIESWFLAAPDLRHIDGNDLETPEEVLALADRLAAPGCHSILVGFNTVAPVDMGSATSAHRAMAEVRNVDRFAPTEVGDEAPDGDRHLVDALIARAARLTDSERVELAAAGREVRDAIGFGTLNDYDRGLGARIAPPGQALMVNQAWSRAIASAGCPPDPNLSFAIGAAAGALAARHCLGQWPGWDGSQYFQLSDPWRTTIGALHPADLEDLDDAVAQVTVRTQPELNAAAADQLKNPDLTIIVDAPLNESLYVAGTTTVTAIGETWLYAEGHAVVCARDETMVSAREHASIEARDNAVVTARFHAEIDAYDSAMVNVDSGVTVEARGAVQVHARGNSIVHARDHVQVTAGADAEVVAYSDTVEIQDLVEEGTPSPPGSQAPGGSGAPTTTSPTRQPGGLGL